MKLTITLKWVPNTEQFDLLKIRSRVAKRTVKVFNQACDYAFAVAWDTGTVRQFDLHREVYVTLRDKFDFSAQLCIRAISKVTDCYKGDRKRKHTFRPLGPTVYDSRVLSYKEDCVSIWAMGGRLKIPFVCGNHQALYPEHIRGKADLILRKRLQSKGTNFSKCLLKKRRRKEQLFARDVNHVISKKVVAKAEGTSRGIALEDLKGNPTRG